MNIAYNKCVFCGYENLHDLSTCVICRKSLLHRVCSYCGVGNRPSARYCKSCGQKISAIEIFFSYAHEDEQRRDKLAKHLNLLKRENLITMWYDRNISAGTSWNTMIDNHLHTANIILLLVSDDFLASDYCYSIEMEFALERCQRNEVIVIPIILRPVDWYTAPFAKFQALPQDAKAVIQWCHEDEAFLSIARGIRRVIKENYVV